MSPVPDPHLERQYNLRLACPEGQRAKRRWAEESAKARAETACLIDAPLPARPGDRVDLFFPEGHRHRSRYRASSVPCFVFLHGGFWRGSDKSDCSFLAPAFCARGAAVAMLNYPLMPTVGLDAIVEDVRTTVAALHTAAEDYGLDRMRFVVGGHSAGAHLAAMVLGTDWRARVGIPDPIRDGVGLSGLYDPRPLRLTSHNELLGLDQGTARALSALRLPPSRRRLGLVACGALDTLGFRRQTRRYARLVNRIAPASCAALSVAGRNHYDILFELADPSSALFRATLSRIMPP